MSPRSILAAAVSGLLLVGAAATPGQAAKPEELYLEVAIAPLFADPELTARLPAGVKYYFGPQPAEVVKEFGPTRSSRMTVRGNRTRHGGCRWALLSTLKAMGEEAQKNGGNAVVSISSKITDEHSSETTFKCMFSGNMIMVSMDGVMATVK
ncbi:MAG: putative phosphoribosylglycinamide formyltransferase [Caulobacter sp.]|nr:putative phosphoribosylglycinamide formyltransferase [Caulobacter sp.]